MSPALFATNQMLETSDERPVPALERVGAVRIRSLVRASGATRDARSNHAHNSRARNSPDIRRTHRDSDSIRARGVVHISPAVRT